MRGNRTGLLVVIAYFGVVFLAMAGLAVAWQQAGLSPDQPIAFPHTIHVSKLSLPCNFCHIYVDISRHAGGAPRGKMHVLSQVNRDGEGGDPEAHPVLRGEAAHRIWNRVYSLPDHVYFSHKRHVKAGLDCSECHGMVGAMKKIRRVGSLKMGWCVSCHRARGAPPGLRHLSPVRGRRGEEKDFLRVLGVLSGSTLLSACGSKTSKTFVSPILPPEEGIIPGEAYFSPSTCTECPAGCGLSGER